ANTAYFTSTALNTGPGTNIVNVGSTQPVPIQPGNTNDHDIVDLVQGPLTVVGSTNDTMNVDDIGSTAAKTGTLTYNTLSGLALGPKGISYSGLANLNIALGSSGNTFTVVADLVSGTTTTIDSGTGNDLISLQANVNNLSSGTRTGSSPVL